MKKLLLIVFAVFAVYNSLAQSELKKISLEDLNVHGTFNARSVRGIKSMNDGETYTVSERGGKIVKYNYSSGNSLGVLFDASEFEISSLLRFSSYDLSADEKMILLATDVIPIYRHSYTANHYIFDIESKTIEPLSEKGAQMLATFSPNGKQVAFVRDNNIFLKNLTDKVETQVTFDGKFNHIINGLPDWVYEEEFHLTTGFHWSPDSRKIAFYRFDESHVKLFNMAMYNNELYPPSYSFKYPKAGEENSLVTIHVFDLEKGTTTKMDVGTETDQYIARIKWTPNNQNLSMVRLNRLQNKVEILLANPENGASTVLYAEDNRYYIEEPSNDYPMFTSDGRNFIIASERDGFNHIYLYGMDGKLVRQLTSGSNEVNTIYGFDAKSKRIYYNGLDNTPLKTAVYYVTLDGKKRGRLSPKEGSNSANFSEGYKYFIHFHSSINTPPVVTLHNSTGKELRVLEDNSSLKQTLAKYVLPEKEFFTFTTSEGIELNGYMVKPLGFSSDKKYPVMLYQYSGPGSQTVVDRFRITWDEYLATEGYMVVCVDGRGTGGRGEEFKKITYGKLGYYESIDQIETGKFLQSLPYVDAERIGIWGWSYGGYMSSLCLFKAPEVFRMAIAVAPVTTWRFYDTIYTERYMGLPQDNPSGYDDNSPINHVDGLQGKLLLVHGTGDDNVHVQNAIEMAEKLIQANKQFDMMMYPDKNHGIFGGNTRIHLYTMMSNYVKANL